MKFSSPFVTCLLLSSLCSGLCACSSDDSSGNGNGLGGANKGPDESLAQADCYVGLQISDVEYSGTACSGSTQDSTVSALGPDSWDDIRVTLTLALNAPPALGLLDVKSLTIDIPNASGTADSWTAPVDACSFTAQDSNLDADMGWTYYRIDVACTSPATGVNNPALAPLELGQFSLVTFFAS